MLPFLQPTEVYTSPCPIPEELWLHTSFLWFAFILGESFHYCRAGGDSACLICPSLLQWAQLPQERAPTLWQSTAGI